MEQKQILVVDDERHMQRLLQFNLEKTGCKVHTAGSGEEAVTFIEKNAVDLVLIDLVMAGMDGFETVGKMRLLPGCGNIPVIMLTSRGQAATRERADGLGVSAFLTKPFSPMELVAEAKKLLNL
jgi:CheY-like chemotaxis protein